MRGIRMFFVLFCFGIIGIVLWTSPAHAAPKPKCQQHLIDFIQFVLPCLLNDIPLDTCNANLSTCNSNLNTCNSDLSTCNSNLAQAQGDLSSCNSELSTCSSDLGTCQSNLTQAQSDLNTCNADLAACQAEPNAVFPGDGYPNPDAFGVSGHGPALSYTNNNDGTFTDNITGLMWEIKTNVVGSVHYVLNPYNWSATGTAPDGRLFTVFLHTLNNTCAGDETTPCTSDIDCTGIGNGECGFAGFQDWCIPDIKKLQSIVDYSTSTPASSVPGLTDNGPFWSATTVDGAPQNVWVVDFSDGFVHDSILKRAGGDFGGNVARAVRPCL